MLSTWVLWGPYMIRGYLDPLGCEVKQDVLSSTVGQATQKESGVGRPYGTMANGFGPGVASRFQGPGF